MPTTSLQGLTESEAQARRARGEGNTVEFQTSRSYVEILRQNAFTFINTILFAIGFILILMNRPGDAVVTAGLVLMNVVVGVVQEGRAKQQLDRIALLTRPQACVIRDGAEKTIDPSQIVRGDVLVVRPGDQLLADGVVVGPPGARMDVDESMLTGESDAIPKKVGDAVCSGSFCISGSACYEAQKLGAQSFANQVTAGARTFRQIKTPLQKDIDFVIRIMAVLAAVIGALMMLSTIVEREPAVRIVQIAAVIVALVPQGLFFMTTITYAMGAVRMAGKGALIQQANAIESLSHVDVLCMDKTGTLTTNRIVFHEAHPLGISETDLKAALGRFAASASAGNKTLEAIAAAFPGQKAQVLEDAPFSSARKWSGLALQEDGKQRVYVLGAPEMVEPGLVPGGPDWKVAASEWAARGLRVLIFARRPDRAPLCDDKGEPQLPSGLAPLGILSFSDELRPEAQATIESFSKAGIRLKIISGDNPETVAALARQAGLDGAQMVSGLDLAKMDREAFAQAGEGATIFGRITPQQKQDLVDSLRQRGHYVAMIGDGVNDVLSLKRAHLGIAMQSGSAAARGVADMVLLKDSFAALPNAFREGQRIVRGMQDIVRLFLARTLYVTLLILGARLVGVAFPMLPKNNSILALLTVGIPTIFLAMWARPGQPPARLLRSVRHFVLAAAVTVALVSLAVYVGYVLWTKDEILARTVLTTVMILCGTALIVFVEPPHELVAGGDELSSDWRPTILAGAMLAAYAAVMIVPDLRHFFDLAAMRGIDYAIALVTAAVWAVALQAAWRSRAIDRLLNLEGQVL